MAGDRGFESWSLQRGVRCELDTITPVVIDPPAREALVMASCIPDRCLARRPGATPPRQAGRPSSENFVAGLRRREPPERRYLILPRSARLPSATAMPARKQAEAFHPRIESRDVGGALREGALVGLREREFYRFRSGVNRPPLDPSYRRLRRRRLAGPPSGP